MTPVVVLDTNVLISAYVFGGGPAALMRAAITGHLTLVTSPTLLAELARIFADKFLWDHERVEAVVLQIARIATIVRPETRVDVIAHDADNRVLEAAMAGSATIIVSGDRHLLALGSHEEVRILTVAEAIAVPS
ncbi:MAG: putative toxin-antitoxin system toxin component, PIN family [Coriobacteriia bacterium]|nr:putative toxin-antitoxin system toxin component, PIN family [Coriobacteriia bacterium]